MDQHMPSICRELADCLFGRNIELVISHIFAIFRKKIGLEFRLLLLSLREGEED